MSEQKKFPHLMVDIESLGTTADSVVLSIGLVPFEMDGTTGRGVEFFPRIQPQFYKRRVMWSSVQWWLKQEQMVRFQQSDAERYKDLKDCMKDLSCFCEENLSKNFKIWGNGFDVAMINQIYAEYEMETPYSYKNIFDTRTLVWLSKISTNKYSDENDLKHSTISDCNFQIRFVVDGYKILRDY